MWRVGLGMSVTNLVRDFGQLVEIFLRKGDGSAEGRREAGSGDMTNVVRFA